MLSIYFGVFGANRTVLLALTAMKNGAVITGTDRLKIKESDRGRAMYEELQKLGGGLLFGDNVITVPKQELRYRGIPLSGHNDHRIVMALSVFLSRLGGAEAVRKSYPNFFADLKRLGAEHRLMKNDAVSSGLLECTNYP